MSAGVDAELFVGHQVFRWGQVGVGLGCFWPECHVFGEDAWPWFVGPVEWAVGVAVAGLFFHGAFQNETV
jgi:hypothetical protein